MKNKIKFILPDFSDISVDLKNPSDPYAYYQKPLTKWLYINRIQYGLNMIDYNQKYASVLEIGYGCGLLLPTISSIAKKEIYGIDIYDCPDECEKIILNLLPQPNLLKMSIEKTDFEDNKFDLIIAFSIFEHLKDVSNSLFEVNRILKPNGKFLLGIPRVDKIMDKLFCLIGYNSINEHHFSTYKDVLEKSKYLFNLEKINYFPIKQFKYFSLYYNMLFSKKRN